MKKNSVFVTNEKISVSVTNDEKSGPRNDITKVQPLSSLDVM